MKLLLLLLVPTLALAQPEWKKQRDFNRRADTTHFPNPFEFKSIDTCGIEKTELYRRCYAWLTSKIPNLRNRLQMEDSVAGKIIASGIGGVGDDITFRITIDIKEGRYRCLFDQYTVNNEGTIVPIEQETPKHYFMLNTFKLIAVETNESLFKSLHEDVRKTPESF